MSGLPPLIEEDVLLFDGAVDDLLRRSDAAAILIIDKGGPLITQRGALDGFDTTTIAALAAGSFSATQAIAERVGETTFSHIYQEGQRHSLLLCNIDDSVLLIVIFKADISVGVVKYYAAATVGQLKAQLERARQRSPQESLDLVAMNLLDTTNLFKRSSQS
jgi:predicted regulator of Ras-like GTPase activity (Roadblock/LC7/MglB family)